MLNGYMAASIRAVKQGKYAAEVNIGMENKNGKAVLISPAKHSLTFNGARNTKFGVTNMTLRTVQRNQQN